MRTLLLALALTAASASAQVLVPIMAGNERAGTPTDSPGMGTYSSTQSVTLSDPTAATILYTTDGSTPACPATGTLYTGAFNISVTTTLKAIGCNGVTGGGVLTSVYTINLVCGTTGTTAWEDWNSGSDPVWTGGSSVAHQTWLKVTGTTQAIVTAPYTGFVCANVLELPTAGTALELDAVGSIPYVPSNSGSVLPYDIFMEFAYSSTTVNAFNTVLEFDYPGTGTIAIQLENWTSGSGQFQVNGGTLFSMSAAARHILDFHLASGSNNSYVTVDGGSHVGAFTVAAADWNRLRLFGSTSTANVYVGNVYTSITGATGGFPPTSFFDSAGLSNGVTVTGTTLASSLHCGNTGTQFDPPVYTPGGSTDKMEGDTSNTIPFPTTLTLCGSSYTGSTGISLRHNAPSGSAPAAFASVKGYTAYATVYVGGYWKTNFAGNTTRVDQGGWGGGNGWLWGSYSSSSSSCSGGAGGNGFFCICIEQEPAGSDIGCAPISNNTWYYITGDIVTNGHDTVSVYNVNQSTGAIGSLVQTFSPIDGGNLPGGWVFELGSTGSESPLTQADSYYSNWTFSQADGSLPLGPY